jgi:hypothetical protein
MQYSFGKGKKEDRDLIHLKETRHKPGPGQNNPFHAQTSRTSPKFGFGTAKRPELGYKKDNGPGPGAYKVPCRIMDTPAYA